MAALKLGRPSSLAGPRALSRTQGILLETMQLVEPRKTVPVANHLLESKLYSKTGGNSVIKAEPSVLHFAGFEIGATQDMVLHLGNVSTEVQRMHIIPPQTKHFKMKYKKNDRLVPGLSLDCTVEFTADEWRYYYDCIRIHCKGEENLIIPIHAYPIMGTEDFPKTLDFPPVPIGHSAERVIPLRCNAPIDFEFQLVYLQTHPSFTVEPMAGVVPAQGEVDVVVRFAPTEFSTAHMKMQLTVSQFSAKPLVCYVTGCSAPGLAKQITEASFEYVEDTDLLLDPRSITPVERARRKKRSRQNKEIKESENQEIEKDGIRFPLNMDTPYAVGQVLNQEPGKLRIKDLRDAVLAKKGEKKASTRQMKEAIFEMAVRKDVYDERQNQLRWQSKVGDDQMSLQQKHDVLEQRESAWRDYKLKRGDPMPEREANRTCTNCTFRRTMRDASKIGQVGVKFDPYTNDMWAVRHASLSKFQQAARKIIIRRRADKNLKGLRQMMIDWSKKKYNLAITPGDGEEEKEEEEARDGEDKQLAANRVKSVTFPTYVEPNVKDDMAVDALGLVPYKPIDVVVPQRVPYFNLKVPKVFHLMGYTNHNVQEASANYVPPNLVKTLRTGAEDEVITLTAPALSQSLTDETPINEGDMKVDEVTDAAGPATDPVPLRPPEALFKPIDYPPLHIFNPAPGLQVFQAPLPYAEVDPDFHLCALPRYTTTAPGPHTATQKHYLDKEDIIKGVMAWKKFPSQGLTSLANTPTLTGVWVPRWNDPFVSDLLPGEVPSLAEGLTQSEKQNSGDDEDDEDVAVTLTPDMVNAQFPLIDRSTLPDEKTKQKDVDIFPQGNRMPATNAPASHHGPVPREQRETELDFYMKKKYNYFGAKIQQRVAQLNSLKTSPDLVLK